MNKDIGDCGFCFDLDKDTHRLSKSTMVTGDKLDTLLDEFSIHSNDDNIFIYCKKCGKFMMFLGNGYWECPECGTKTREMTPYHQLERENQKYLKDEELDSYGDDDDYDEYYGYLG